MCQQTQVATVIPYFNRFMTRFPNIETLATAEEDEVLEHWAGLGYYSRGRNLHKTAQQLVREHAGKMPESSEELRQLPGIGPYTSNAISSICFDEAVAVIDGNVERVLARFLGLQADPRRGAAKRLIVQAAQIALDPKNPGDHNQGMMELGATICTPKRVKCERCPIQSDCAAFSQDLVDKIPPPKKRRPTELQHWVAVLAFTDHQIWLPRAGASAKFLRGQGGFPLQQLEKPEQAMEIARQMLPIQPPVQVLKENSATPIHHAITFRKLSITPILFQLSVTFSGDGWRPLNHAHKLPSLHAKLLAQLPGGKHSS